MASRLDKAMNRLPARWWNISCFPGPYNEQNWTCTIKEYSDDSHFQGFGQTSHDAINDCVDKWQSYINEKYLTSDRA